MTVLTALNVYDLPLPAAVALTLTAGAVCGAVNGFLIGFLRLRAFLTTLVTLILFRAAYELLVPNLATQIVLGVPDSEMWTEFQTGSLFSLSYSVYVAGAIAI